MSVLSSLSVFNNPNDENKSIILSFYKSPDSHLRYNYAIVLARWQSWEAFPIIIEPPEGSIKWAKALSIYYYSATINEEQKEKIKSFGDVYIYSEACYDLVPHVKTPDGLDSVVTNQADFYLKNF